MSTKQNDAGQKRADRLMEAFNQCEEYFMNALNTNENSKLHISEAKKIIKTKIKAPLPHTYNTRDMMISLTEERSDVSYDHGQRCLHLE